MLPPRLPFHQSKSLAPKPPRRRSASVTRDPPCGSPGRGGIRLQRVALKARLRILKG
jgi:hypothetical protein